MVAADPSGSLRVDVRCADYWATPDRGLLVTVDGVPTTPAGTNGATISGFALDEAGNVSGPYSVWTPTDVGFDVAPGPHRVAVDAPGCASLVSDARSPLPPPRFSRDGCRSMTRGSRVPSARPIRSASRSWMGPRPPVASWNPARHGLRVRRLLDSRWMALDLVRASRAGGRRRPRLRRWLALGHGDVHGAEPGHPRRDHELVHGHRGRCAVRGAGRRTPPVSRRRRRGRQWTRRRCDDPLRHARSSCDARHAARYLRRWVVPPGLGIDHRQAGVQLGRAAAGLLRRPPHGHRRPAWPPPPCW